MPTFKESTLRDVVKHVFEAAGSEPQEAEVITDHLVRANLMGHDSHGVGMIPDYIANLQAGLLKPNVHAELIQDESSLMRYDGAFGYGQVQAKEAMASALTRCEDLGLVLMTLKNAHHIGRIGTYGEQAIEAGFISIHFVNVIGHPPMVAPYGGREGRFITNPICIAMPGTERTEAILLDMATSKIALGKARVAMNKREEVPEGSIIDPQGQQTQDPNVLFQEPKGALLPFGHYKGSGLALFCELLAGGLSGGGTSQPGNSRHGAIINNMFTIIVDPARLVDQDWLSAEIDALVNYVKNTPTDAVTKRVRVAGEPEREASARRQVKGVPIAEDAWTKIIEAAKLVGVTLSTIKEILNKV